MALVNSYQGFIFDYGGVLVHHQTEADQRRLAEVASIPQQLFSSGYWDRRLDYDKDLVSASEYWQNVAESAGTLFTEEIIERLVELDNISWMHFDSVMWDWIDQLRGAGKRVGMLSNMPRDLGEELKLQTRRLDSFDHVTLSYEVRSAKPEPAIYEHCIEGLGVPPEQTVFLDDRIVNIHGAELFGIRGIQFTDRDDVLLRLRS